MQQERIRRGLSEKEVADQLHITMHYVRSLEANNYDKLPGAVFAKGYIKNYAQLLELDEVELSFEGLTEAGGLLGHGGFVCYGEDFSPREEVIHWMNFFAEESCGKCTPCRIGTRRALEILDRVGTGEESGGDRDLLTDLDELMTNTSLCALGGLAMNPVRSTMEKWPEAFTASKEK
jgi:formate dehydrogenase iron-sulfur subunit